MRLTGNDGGWQRVATVALLFVGSIFSEHKLMAAQTGVAAVWAVNDGEKIRQEDTGNGNRARNSVWDGRAVAIAGAKNEVVAFQVIVTAGAAGAKAVDVKLEKLVGPNGRTLTWKPTPADPTDWRGREIERFTEHYLHIEKQTNPGWFYNPQAKPKEVTGWLPDALVPDSATGGRGGLPIDIAADKNQGVWFDVYIPKDAAAGDYSGTIQVTAGGEKAQALPVTLKVYNFALPDENHFRAMICFGEDQLAARHGKNSPALAAAYHRLAHRHRVEFVSAFGPNSSPDRLDLLSGAAFKQDCGYVGPGEGVGNVIAPASFYGCGANWKNDDAWKTADSFMTWLNKTKPGAITFLYITDEPPKSKFPEIKTIGDKHHANPGPGKALPMYVTHGPAGGLEGAIDIWCTVTNQYSVDEAKEQKEKGRKWWVYNGHRPAAGTELTDAPAVDPRVTPVACHKYGIELWFYWMANQWRHNSQHPRGDQNVWVDPVTFGGNGGCNGDGVLIYAGEDKKHPDQDRGIAGPIASIRLKNIRRGMQDVEYLWLAEQHGLAAQAKAAQDAWVPKAFSEARGDVAWSVAGSDWDAARKPLAAALEQKLAAGQPTGRAPEKAGGRVAVLRPTPTPEHLAAVAALRADCIGRICELLQGGARPVLSLVVREQAQQVTVTTGEAKTGLTVKANGAKMVIGWTEVSPGLLGDLLAATAAEDNVADRVRRALCLTAAGDAIGAAREAAAIETLDPSALEGLREKMSRLAPE